MRLTSFIEYSALLAGALAIVVGGQLARDALVLLGVYLTGATLLLAGVESIYTRRAGFRLSDYAWRNWEGAPAVILGAMLLVVGAAVLGVGYALSVGTWSSALRFLGAHPGLVLACLGALTGGAGMLLVVVREKRSGGLGLALGALPRLAVGAAVAILGIVLCIGGVWHWLDPWSFEHFAATVAGALDLEWPQGAWRGTVMTLR